ncbi:hypothetical protein AADC60_25015 [Cytobacillus pseudoceanisediminis]|uniref:Uncharacterized protein n=3 Tax=Bacillati TaxID=1783272 RepID=A0ABX3CNC1_9BACI|nr:hypothetical protein [Cytobacillus oceanisediminis]EFV78264.1 hypothetical protein HMPREF1013_01452 [Bacillus sp. 2_A_57_CT2]OHX45316.1 hypothetical protein BBV17_23745 [Cytobacillus oceanisediminis]QOK25850.1 hypothetical protein IIE26_19510 [Cytobacillus oceanisediminis]
MKKLVILFLIIFLSACSADEQRVEEMIDRMAASEELSEILSFGYVIEIENDGTNVLYDLHLTVEDTYDAMTYSEQKEIFEKVISYLENETESASGDLDCGEDYTCSIRNLELSTYSSENEYLIEYGPSVYAISKNGEPYEDETEVAAEEPAEQSADAVTESGDEAEVADSGSTETDSFIETASYPDTDFSTADGEDWVQLTDDEKYSMVSQAMDTFNSSGKFVITEGPEWFLDALNAFYGDGTTAEDQAVSAEKVSDVMLMSGLAGGVFVE